MLKAFIAAINRISDWLGVVSGILICILASLMMYDVFMRFVLNDPVDWTLDIGQLLQAAVAFLSASYVLKIGGHVTMEAVVSYVSPEWARRLEIMSTAITALASAWMAFLSWSLFTKSLAISEQSFGIEIPMAPWKFLVTFGFGVMGLQALATVLSLWLRPERSMQEGKEGH